MRIQPRSFQSRFVFVGAAHDDTDTIAAAASDGGTGLLMAVAVVLVAGGPFMLFDLPARLRRIEPKRLIELLCRSVTILFYIYISLTNYSQFKCTNRRIIAEARK